MSEFAPRPLLRPYERPGGSVRVGFTTPSHTGVEVVGELRNDLAFAVTFENPHTQLWFAPELLEFVDYGARQDMQIGNKRWVRQADGSWEEVKEH